MIMTYIWNNFRKLILTSMLENYLMVICNFFFLIQDFLQEVKMKWKVSNIYI